MTATELALNALASTVARELYVSNGSHGFQQISGDIDVAGRIEAAAGRAVVSQRKLLRESDSGVWKLPEETVERSE
jgi:hypothetical protein